MKLGRLHMRSRVVPGRHWESNSSNPITGMTLILFCCAPPNGMAALRERDAYVRSVFEEENDSVAYITPKMFSGYQIFLTQQVGRKKRLAVL